MNIVFFESEGTSRKYGLSTYALNIVNGIKGVAGVRFYHVHLLSTKVSEVCIQEEGNVVDIFIPFDVRKMSGFFITRLTARAAYCLVSEVADLSLPTVFHLNSNLQWSICELLKGYSWNSIIYTVHLSLWKELFDNDHEKFLKARAQRDDKMLIFIDMEMNICSAASQIICLTADTKEYIINDYGIPAQKIALIGNGIQVPVLDSQEDVLSIKEELGLIPREQIVMFAGRLHPTKGLSFLIDAFKLVLKKRKNVRLIIAGNEHVAHFGGFENYIDKCNGARSYITFTGYLEKEELYKFYRLADVGVIPSLHEQSCYVGLEMMSNGLPMIVCDIPAFEQVVEHNVSALKVKLDKDKVSPDIQEMADAIIRLLSDPLFAAQMKEKAREAVLEQFSSQRMVNQLMATYRKVTETAAIPFL
ncbi:glycosyltransferase [Chitinophaga sp. 22536]|uniref:glycosyltransferase n=1 Tax=unclassified Chitinophaga TaxID=2619133 RepID=UPI003F87D1BA